jgi:hypothetical protein
MSDRNGLDANICSFDDGGQNAASTQTHRNFGEENEFSTDRIASALSKLHTWNALLNLYFLFSAIALQKKAPAIAFVRGLVPYQI